MGDIRRLLLGGPRGEDGDGDRDWGPGGRRPRVADSREWCGSAPGEESIENLAAALKGRRGGKARAGRPGRARRPFGL